MTDRNMTNEAPRADKRVGGVLGSTRYKEYELAGYAEVVRAYVPQWAWSGVFFSWLSLKGHLQGLHQFDRTELFCTAGADGRVEAVFAIIWQGADTMSAWLEKGYSAEKMLTNMGIPAEDMQVQLMRDFS